MCWGSILEKILMLPQLLLGHHLNLYMIDVLNFFLILLFVDFQLGLK